MKHLPIKIKLALLAGIPVLGALILALFVARSAQAELAKTAGLGSVESLAELSNKLSTVARELEIERALSAYEQGLRAPLEAAGPERALLHTKIRAELVVKRAETDRALAGLSALVRSRDASKLPPRLTRGLGKAERELAGLGAFRRKVDESPVELTELVGYYGATNRSLITSLAALGELSDDGELLRSIHSLVTTLELAERVSAEHALLAYVLAARTFPPGSYRELVTLVTEQDTYAGVLQTSASEDLQRLYNAAVTGEAAARAKKLREAALAATEEEPSGDPQAWFADQKLKLERVEGVAGELNQRVAAQAARKLEEIRRAVWLSAALVFGTLVPSALLAYFVGRNVNFGLFSLASAAKKIGQGNLDVRVELEQRDEIGQLASAFNEMTSEIKRARSALDEQARMTRELEIAASIQTSLLPPDPSHPDFEFAGKMTPADEVGGDFYDVLRGGRDDALWITIGDVSSHGLSAGLVMLMAQAAFATHFHTDPNASPDKVLRGVNSLLRENIAARLKQNKYLTAQLLAYRGDGRFTCAGAHQWPVILRARTKRCEIVETPGPWLGILPELDDVPLIEITLEPGDVLCLYSDGLTEAVNDDGDLFDTSRLSQALKSAIEDSDDLDAAAARIFERVQAYSGRHDDDWTLLLVRRREDAESRRSAA